ncbi:TIGR02679 family protein [Bacillus alkalisoli]|uniref:TIGR02679 family protein n=1 Tax=Bacillus alkalisoli TaxID=2011008 RepID=UPI000C239FCF|nr:TIGR02679 family protein [Bacillus alkalisoli]
MSKMTDIFKAESGFMKLFQLFKKKYCSIGRVGGTVSLTTFHEVELQPIAGFMGQPVEVLVKKGKISLQEFEIMLQKSRFSSYSLLQLLEEVLQEKLVTNKEAAERERGEEERFFLLLKDQLPSIKWWIDWIQAKPADARWVWTLYKRDKKELFRLVSVVNKALSNLPRKGEYERLPFFSQKITGNPHSFDLNGTLGKLLLHSLYVYEVVHKQTEMHLPRSTEEINELLNEFGIVKDDLWNFITCQGLLATSSSFCVHPVWEAAVKTNSVMNVPMKELIKTNKIWPAVGKDVWVLENSSVSSSVMDAVPHAPIICTHGQIRMAGWYLLDRLVEAGCIIYYSGDFDPEGLVIAERLKKRFKDKLVLWRMDIDSYKESLSNENLTTDRLTKLNNIQSVELQQVKQKVQQTGKAGYQEALIEKLIQDVK